MLDIQIIKTNLCSSQKSSCIILYLLICIVSNSLIFVGVGQLSPHLCARDVLKRMLFEMFLARPCTCYRVGMVARENRDMLHVLCMYK